MAIKIIDHGDWNKAVRLDAMNFGPEVDISKYPGPGTLFTTRKSDGVEWYEYVQNPNTFKSGSLVVTCLAMEGTHFVQGVFLEWDRCFPAMHRVIEISGWVPEFDGQKPWDVYHGMLYDENTKKIRPNTERVNMNPQFVSKMTLINSLTDDEALKWTDILAKLSPKSKLLWDSTNAIMAGTEHYTELFKLLSKELGKARATTLLSFEE